MKKTFSRSELITLGALALILWILLPWLNSAGVVSDFNLGVWGKYGCYAILAISVDLLWGYTGLLSLGQSLFFSLGGYMLGMHLMLLIREYGSFAKSGQNPNLIPDFMFFQGFTELPGFWKPFSSFAFAALMVFLVPGLISALFGWMAFRSRIKGVYFSILTQTLTYGFALLFFRNALVMGGNNGFTDFRFILGQNIRSAGTQRGLFIATAVALLGIYAACRWLTGTKFGLIQRAIRDSETRVLFSGYPVARYKLFVFVVSGLIAAIGGALYVPQVRLINPSEMTTDKSLEAVVWCAVGGRGTLIGPIIGAVAVNALKSWATHAYPDYWLIFLGGMFMLVVLFLPGGIVSVPGLLRNAIQRRRAHAAQVVSTPVLTEAPKEVEA
jgi:urea ABC transporter permease protein UrtC